jgi:RNA polymerase sigma factor for flagellar operon FliA
MPQHPHDEDARHQQLILTGDSYALVKEYKRSNARALRDCIIQRYMPLVRNTAIHLRKSSLASTTLDIDDLFQLGAVGLIQALERFDPDRTLNFAVYAVIRIRGAMIDGIREQSLYSKGAIRRNRALEEISERRYQQTGRVASQQELAEASGLSLKQVVVAMRVVKHFAEVDCSEPCDSDRNIAAVDNAEFVAHALNNSNLSDRERLVVEGYDLNGVTMDRLGQFLEVSSSMVFRIRASAFDKIYSRYGSAYLEGVLG